MESLNNEILNLKKKSMAYLEENPVVVAKINKLFDKCFGLAKSLYQTSVITPKGVFESRMTQPKRDIVQNMYEFMWRWLVFKDKFGELTEDPGSDYEVIAPDPTAAGSKGWKRIFANKI